MSWSFLQTYLVVVAVVALFAPAPASGQGYLYGESVDSIEATREAQQQRFQQQQPTELGQPGNQFGLGQQGTADLPQCEGILNTAAAQPGLAGGSTISCPTPGEDILPTQSLRLRYRLDRWKTRLGLWWSSVTAEEQALHRAQQARINQLRCKVINCVQLGNTNCANRVYSDLTDQLSNYLAATDELAGGTSPTSQRLNAYVECTLGVATAIRSIDQGGASVTPPPVGSPSRLPFGTTNIRGGLGDPVDNSLPGIPNQPFEGRLFPLTSRAPTPAP